MGGAGVAIGRAEASMAEKKVMGGRVAGVCGAQQGGSVSEGRWGAARGRVM